MGIDRWVRNFFYVNQFDSFEGSHPRVFVPKERPYREFSSMEDICNYLLAHEEVIAHIRAKGPGGKAVFVMFDEETEALAAQARLVIAHPRAELRHRLDSKIVTTQLGNEAGVPSAPNTLGRARTYDELLELADSAGLGDDLVVQTPYGDSGKTTFFIRGQRDWDEDAAEMVDQSPRTCRSKPGRKPKRDPLSGAVVRLRRRCPLRLHRRENLPQPKEEVRSLKNDRLRSCGRGRPRPR